MSTGNTIREDIILALGSEYDIVRELGRGGASVVYLARDRVLGREVAIKVIRDTQSVDAEAIARFEREARTLASLQHPNIVMLYGAKPLPGGSLALVMQHGEWSTLKAVIREQGPLPTEAVQQVLQDLSKALVYLHRHHVVHRDIKPENIFIEADTGRALLSDFGIAKSGDARASVTLAGVVIGTPAYMSPEQIDGAELTGRSDLYSLGMVGYEMLTGVRPWEGETLFGVIYKQKTEKLPPLAQIRPDTPEALRTLIERATEKEPDARWASAEEMLQEITGSSVATAPVAWAEPAAVTAIPEFTSPSDYPTLEIEQALAEQAFGDIERDRRRRQRLTAAAVILLLFSGGAGALAFSGREAPQDGLLDARAPMEAQAGHTGADSYDGSSAMPVDTMQFVLDTPIIDSLAAVDSADPRVSREVASAARESTRVAAAPSPQSTAPADSGIEGAVDADILRGPPVVLPELSIVRPNSTVPRAQPSRVLESRPAEPVVPPQLRNREQIGNLMAGRYPTDLRARGIGGTTIVTVLVSPNGSVETTRVVTSSGNSRLDQAALSVARRLQFEYPAGTRPQPVWVTVPLTFTEP